MHYVLQIFKRNYHNNLSIKYIKYFKSKLDADDYLKNTFKSYVTNTVDVDHTMDDCVTGYVHDSTNKIIYDFSLLIMPCMAEDFCAKQCLFDEEYKNWKNETFVTPNNTTQHILDLSKALDNDEHLSFDRSVDSLPAGWIYDYNNVLTPIKMSELKVNPELVIPYGNLTTAQQKALVIARINKIPEYKYDETLYTHLNAKMCLEHINKNTTVANNIILKEINWLQNYLDNLLEEHSSDFTNDTDESSDDEEESDYYDL